MQTLGGNKLEDRILADLKTSFGIRCNKITPVHGGWLNQLWKATADSGELLIKQYSLARFSFKQLQLIEAALQRQITIEKDIACPHIYLYKGKAIRWIEDQIAYCVMTFCPGKNETAETITISQMSALGNVCALIHKSFSKLPPAAVKGYPIDDQEILTNLWRNVYTRRESGLLDTPLAHQNALFAQETILKQLTGEFFGRLPKGIAHEDFTPDNILFHDSGVSAVIDFDRNQYSYLWHDIGRAILSFALDNNRLDLSKIDAFIKGYTQHLPLNRSNIADALRLTWCIEVLWWIRPECFSSNFCGKAVRYRDEILWLTDHWGEIDSMLCLC